MLFLISDFGLGDLGKNLQAYFFPKLTPDNADLHRVSEAAALARKPYKRTYGDGWTLWTQQQPWSISRQVLSLIMNPRRRVDNVQLLPERRGQRKVGYPPRRVRGLRKHCPDIAVKLWAKGHGLKRLSS